MNLCRALALSCLISCHSAPAPSAPVAAPRAVETQALRSGTIPSGLGFDLFVPETWWFTPGPQAVLASANRQVTVWIRVVDDAPSAEAAIASSWRRARPDLAQTVSRRTNEDKSETTYDEIMALEYTTPPAAHRVMQALAKRTGTRTLVMLAEGTSEEISARGALLGQVLETLNLPGTALPPEDLTAASVAPLDAGKRAELDAFARKVFEASGLPGLAVSVVQGDHVAFEAGYGTRRVGESAPVTPTTRFLIGSCTKSMTTLLMATRVDEGAFGWDTPVVDVMPSFRVGDATGGKAFRMKDTVCACTGLPRNDFPMIFESKGYGVRELFADLAHTKPTTGFRETYQYNNQIVAVGGLVAAYSIEPKADPIASYARAMKNKVFAPLGMRDTTADFEEGARSSDRASGHGVGLDGVARSVSLDADRFLIAFGPSGGAWSTAHDLGLYLVEELQRGKNAQGKRIVSAAQVEARWAPQVKASSDGSYALGWGVGTDYGLRFVDHSGATMGFESRVSFFPDRGLGIAFVSNGALRLPVGRLLRRRLVELVFGARPKAEADLERAKQQALADLALRLGKFPPRTDLDWATPILGTYTHPTLGALVVKVQDKRVVADAGEWTTELAAARHEANQPERVVFAGPVLTGLPLVIDGRDLVIDTGATRERFVRK